MPVSDSTPSPADFLQVPGPFGHPVLIHRLQAEQSAASGMPVLIALPADAVRLALAGPPKLTDTEQAIIDVLGRVGAPMTGRELADIDEIGVTEQRIRVVLGKSGHLRSSGVVGHENGRGYFLL